MSFLHRLFRFISGAVTAVFSIALLCGVVTLLLQDFLIFPGFAYTKLHGAPPRGKLPDRVTAGFIKSRDGTELEVWHVKLPDGVKRSGTALFFHGNGSFIDSSLYVSGYLEKAGLELFSIEYRGYGRSSGWPSEHGFYQDADALLSYVIQKHEIDPEELVVIGESIGSGVAGYLTYYHNLPVLVLLAGYSSLPDLVQDKPYYRWFKRLVWYKFPVGEYLQKLNDTCVILVHGKLDRIIPFSHYETNLKMISKEAKLHSLIYPEAKHSLWEVSAEDLPKKINECRSEQ